MRIGWIIGGLLLGAGLVVALLLEAEDRSPLPVETAPGPGPTQAPRPGLRGIGAASDAEPTSPEAKAPTPDQVRRWIDAALKAPLGSPRWDSLLERLNVPYADFAPYMTIILEACLRDTAEQCEAGARLLTIALDPGLLNYRMSRQRTPVIPLPSPLRPEHFDLAWRIATSEHATEAAGALFADLRVLPALGPRAHALTPYLMAWLEGERRRDAQAFVSRGPAVACAIGALGPPALRYLDAWVGDETNGGRSLAGAAVLIVGVKAGPVLIGWLGSSDPRVRSGALDLFGSSPLAWPGEVLAAVRDCLRDRDEGVRVVATEALLDWLEDPDVAADFARTLRGPDMEQRLNVLESLVAHEIELDEVPAPLLDAVLAIMSDPNDDEYEAVLAIAELMAALPNSAAMGNSTPGLLRALVRCGTLSDSDGWEGWQAEGTWWSELGPQAWPHLWKALHAKDEALRDAAAWVMAFAGDPDTEHAGHLGRWLEDHDSSPRRTRVASALGDARYASVLPALLAGLKARTWAERGIAAMGLRRLRDDALPHLGALGTAIGDANARRLADRYESLPRRPDLPEGEHEAAALSMESAFRSLARRDLEAAYDLIAHESWDVRYLVRGVLSRARARGLAVLETHWPRATHAERVATLHVLRLMGDHPMWTQVLASFRSGDRAMRVTAAVLVFWDGTAAQAKEAGDVLAAAAVHQSFDKPDMVGHRAATTLRSAGEQPARRRALALASLQRFLDDEAPPVRERAKKLIGEVEKPDGGLPPLR